MFQSRSGFSECFDGDAGAKRRPVVKSFNPVLGFLSASTGYRKKPANTLNGFNPVLGFLSASTFAAVCSSSKLSMCFNPVLGFLSAST